MKKRNVCVKLIVVFCLFFLAGEAQTPFIIRIDSLSDNIISSKPRNVLRTLDKGFIISGYMGSASVNTFNGTTVLKFDSLGNFIWGRKVDEGYFSSTLIERPDTGVYLVLKDQDAMWTHDYFEIVSLDKNGNNTTGAAYAGLTQLYNAWSLNSIDINRNSGQYSITSNILNEDPFTGTIYSRYSYILRFDSSHNYLYKVSSDIHNTGNPGFSNTKDLYLGNNSFETLAIGGSFVMKLDSSGGIIWQKIYPGYYSESIVQDDSSCYLISGSKIRKIDYWGNTIFCKRLDTLVISSIKKTGSSRYLITGEKNYNTIILETDSLLNVLQSVQINSSASLGIYYDIAVEIDTIENCFMAYYNLNFTPSLKLYLEKLYPDSSCHVSPVLISVVNISVQDSVSSFSFGATEPLYNSFLSTFSTLTAHAENIGCVSLLSNSKTNEQSVFRLFPNPTSSTLTLSGNLEKGDKIYLTDALGKIIFSKTILATASDLKIQTQNIADGIYFLQVVNPVETVMKKIVIHH